MLPAEQRARTIEVLKPNNGNNPAASMKEFEEKPGLPCRAINGVLPILALVIGVIGMFVSGEVTLCKTSSAPTPMLC